VFGRRRSAGDRDRGRDLDNQGADEFTEAGQTAAGEAVARGTGPWDVAEPHPDLPRVDLGSLQVPVLEGTDIQLVFAEQHGAWVTVRHQLSELQLQAFAAPKRSGLWDEVRGEIAAEIAGAGGQAAERQGPFGPPHPPRAPHRWGLGAYFLVEAVFLLTSALLAYALAGSLTSSAWAIALALSVPTICAAGLAALITRIRGNGPRIDLGLTMTRRDVVVGVACGFAGLVVTIPASVLYVAIVGADATSAVGEALGGIRATPALAVLIFVLVVFVAPFCEEVVYRGLLWGAVERLGANRWWALAITTFVFALAHFEFSRTPLLLVVAIPIGIARVITGRLPAGVIAHQINNLLPGVVLMLGLLGVVPMT